MARVTDLAKRSVKAIRPAGKAPARREPTLPERTSRYLREVRAELNRVTWPSRQELLASTLVVLVVVTLTALYLGAWDALFTWFFQHVLVR
ncbi:MAG: preprotein translocase subunit SecE [Armatimonadetes bacterium]|nr:preprotein translocase subunit SecE [Armatimonadota bacterium]MDW8154218.1 preprotein translocase subunit SecE [Armatimonadota bacterium]